MKYIILGLICVSLSSIAQKGDGDDGGSGGGNQRPLTLVEQTKLSALSRTGCFDCLTTVESIPNYSGGYYTNVASGSEYNYVILNPDALINGKSFGSVHTTINRGNKLVPQSIGRGESLAAESSTNILIENIAPFERPVILISRGSW
ncbi:MAG: hypothetical protein QM504_03330 [Pseudomonadota bacterium]